jgi:hypothetical protein
MHVPLIDVAFTCHCEVFPKVWLDFGVSKVPLKGQKARISPRRRHGRAAPAARSRVRVTAVGSRLALTRPGPDGTPLSLSALSSRLLHLQSALGSSAKTNLTLDTRARARAPRVYFTLMSHASTSCTTGHSTLHETKHSHHTHSTHGTQIMEPRARRHTLK